MADAPEKHIELYKKYRPTTWKGLIGQSKVAKSLQSAVKAHKLPTAYLFSGPRGCGKALHRDTEIPTPFGFTTMEALEPGDFVLGADGAPTRVTHKYCPSDPESYEITFSDGTKVRASAGHLWEVEDTRRRGRQSERYRREAESRLRIPRISTQDLTAIADLPERVSVEQLAAATQRSAAFYNSILRANGVAPARKAGYPKSLLLKLLEEAAKEMRADQRRPLERCVLTTEEIFKTYLTADGGAQYSIDVIAAPVSYAPREETLPIDPYALGVWLGDGTSSSPHYGCSSEDAAIMAERINAAGVVKAAHLSADKRRPNLHCYKLTLADGSFLTPVLRDLGVLNNKHIPDAYLYGSVETRRALLAGLLDTDGTVDKSGRVGFGQKEGRLFWQVVELVHSLGYQTRIHRRSKEIHPGDVREYPSLQFYTTDHVFQLPRKNARLKKELPLRQKRRYITAVEPVLDNPEDYYCIAVESEDQLFLATRSFIKTHNTSAALLLAKAINCLEPTEAGDPCNHCDVCVAIDEGRQLGVNYISAANLGSGGAERIREIVQQARLHQPIKQQVWIVDEIHNLHKAAFDALLIPLEEKNMPALFIFCTTEINKVPQTILSRVQPRKFNLVDADLMLRYVKHIGGKEGLELSDEAYETAVREGRGSVRDTLTALEGILSAGVTSAPAGGKLVEALAAHDITPIFQVIAQANADGEDCRNLTEQLFEDLRGLLLHSAGVEASLVGILPTTKPDEVTRGLLGRSGITAVMDEVGDALTQMSMGADSRIHLEVAMVKSLNRLKRIKKAMDARS